MGVKCCNPFKVPHSKKQHSTAKLITDLDRCREVLPNFEWSEKQHICVRCRLKILQHHKLLQIVKTGVRLALKPTTAPQPVHEDVELDDPAISVREVDQSSGNDVPTAPLQSLSTLANQPGQPEEPCSSQQAQERQRRMDFPTPAGSVAISSVTGSPATTFSDSSDVRASKISEQLNKSLQDVTVSPVRPSDVKKPHLLRRKLQKLKSSTSEALKKITGVESSPQTDRKRKCVFCSTLFRELADQFKHQATRADKYKLLTSIPKRFSITEVHEATGCSQYLARISSKLKLENGAFTYPPRKYGRPMDPNMEDIIRQFYLDDQNSRPSPNLRDVIQVKMASGERVSMEKRRLLHNLVDLFNEFKTMHPEIQVSVSKFSKLRPRNCVWPGLRGHHVTCVCEIHQNFEFYLEATDCGLSVSEFVQKVVCENDEDVPNVDCHLGLCSKCPNNEFLDSILQDLLADDNITLQQWVHTDSTEIQDITMDTQNFRTAFLEYIPKIIEHEYVTQKQKRFIKNLRENTIKHTAAVTVQVDFAQNYSFIVQNSVQGFHWSNKQATVHPFVVHWWNGEEEALKYKTYCVISDELSHDADTFHVFRSFVMPLVKTDLELLMIQRVFYISDGAAGQYKNFKNFSNLMLHKADYDVDAEWHFTSTSHGKGTCDAMSAVVKCATRRQSLKPGQFITTPQQMFEFCQRQLTSATCSFVYVSKEDVAAQKDVLAERYKHFKTIQGTRKNHAFIPKDGDVMSMGRTSDSNLFCEIDFKTVECHEFSSVTVKVGAFYAFFESNNYNVGLLVEVDSVEGDVKFQIMKLNRRTRTAVWPDQMAFCDVAFRDLLMELRDPTTDDGFTYQISKEEMTVIRQRSNLYKAKLTPRV